MSFPIAAEPAVSAAPSAARNGHSPAPVVVRGDGLTIEALLRASRFGAPVRLTDDAAVLDRVRASQAFVERAVERGEPIYGITSGFGGMANVAIPREAAEALQNNLPWFLKTGAGKKLPAADVRAGMVLRANALMRGISGIRLAWIERLVAFLNAGVAPHVCDLGSIGASGDLVPLGSVAGALAGLGNEFRVDYQDRELGAVEALAELGLAPMALGPKEGLALMNGTSMLTGIAAGCVYDARRLAALALAAHALMLQGLGATNQSFHPFIHDHKPHPGQRFAADAMLALLDGSALIRDELDGRHDYRGEELLQDRYSVRCLPQFVGPILDGLATVGRQVETEMNSVSDNPIFDTALGQSYHGGNFLGQYVAVAMDQMRYHLGMLAKHLDVQIALLVEPAFSGGLPPSLVGNPQRRVNMGLKGLQISGNSMMPLLTYYGNSLADRFPTHAEQYNQNINSQGFGSANLARRSVEIFQQYIAVALMFGVQAVDLRTYREHGHYDARAVLSPATCALYEAVREVVGTAPSEDRPYIYDDHDQPLDVHIAALARDVAAGGRLPHAVGPLVERLSQHLPC